MGSFHDDSLWYAQLERKKDMTEPTQAQIEAAAKVAAQMANGGNWDDPLFYKPEHKIFWHKILEAALTAAAEVGGENECPVCGEEVTIINATIERCEKAVWDAGGDNVEFHCAAIRALKDKP